LEAARAKEGAGRVTWVEGTSEVLPDQSFDVAVMTSHVAQFFVTEHEWACTLADLHRSLVPGGRLVFDTRAPRDRTWEQWNPDASRRRVTLPDGRIVAACTEVNAVHAGHVSFTIHYDFPGGEELVSTATLRFRSEDELRASLDAAGFTVEQIFGGWDRQSVGEGDGELLVIARA
jgi:SAM-dependent methyltransferase